jgi:hypothetical protein
MGVDISGIFTAIDVAKSVAELAGIIESIDAKIDRLIQSELNAGLRALEQAAYGTPEQVELLREARGCFNKAAGVELGYRKVLALLGLSMSHFHLGDKPNCTRALEEILTINPVTTLKLITAAGQRGIRNSIRESNPFTLWKRMKEMEEKVKEDVASGKGLIERIIRTDDFEMNYGMLAFSGRARKAYKRKLVLDAISMSQDASAIWRVQESVAELVGTPIPWLQELK